MDTFSKPSFSTTAAVIQVNPDTVTVCCPPQNVAHWNQHPRVYLSIAPTQITACPYCGNQFQIAQAH